MKKLIRILVCTLSILLVVSGCNEKNNKVKENAKTSYKVQIKTNVDKYSLSMSFTPGIGLTGEFPNISSSKVVYHWTTEYGSFLSWEVKSGIITNLGKDVKNSGDTVYWSPLEGMNEVMTKDGKVILKIEDTGNSKILSENNISIHKDEKGIFYTVINKSNPHEFAIYKTKVPVSSISNTQNTEYEDPPILTENDIKNYDWKTNEIELTDSYLQSSAGTKKINDFMTGGSELLNAASGVGFALFVKGEEIYTGGFSLSPISSACSPEIEISDVATNKILIKCYTGKEDVLRNPKIYNVLKNLGKIKE